MYHLRPITRNGSNQIGEGPALSSTVSPYQWNVQSLASGMSNPPLTSGIPTPPCQWNIQPLRCKSSLYPLVCFSKHYKTSFVCQHPRLTLGSCNPNLICHQDFMLTSFVIGFLMVWKSSKSCREKVDFQKRSGIYTIITTDI